MPVSQRRSVITQDRAQTHERVVDLGDLGGDSLLVATDRADEIALQFARRDGKTRESDAGQAVPNTVEGRAARTDDEHATSFAHERTHGVDDSLGSTGSRQGVHHDGLARGDPS